MTLNWRSLSVIVALIIFLFGAGCWIGASLGYDEGYADGVDNGTIINFSPPHLQYTPEINEDDIELRLAEMMIEAMSSAEADFIIKDGDVESAEIHIRWEK